ncbi:MAG: tRNA uridine-5-carboxymethylaminomethyl(34) synthesis GTPase MnmE [Firmicutes bacterium]|nr:tRNA uridine-5-carboxymethylaminomethyl(34) synthesis GTPase MnmE [Bacillota bacterium]
MLTDTIAAIATAVGESGIGIIRVSGEQAIAVVDKVFSAKRAIRLRECATHTLHLGYIIDPVSGEKVDEVLVSLMRRPKSFTGEDVVEINCHGGLVPLRKTLELLLKAGARMAEPGEFTKRAFLNGRIDLAQAESVIDIIRAKTDASLNVALGQLEGRLSERIRDVRRMIVELLAFIEANIDFPEEDIEEISRGEILARVETIRTAIADLLISAEQGRVYREGLRVVIVGRPNVGKSSLLNALLKEKRAIVTDIPGTTRDVLEEILNIRGIPVRIIDTAGIRETGDPIERIGVEKAQEYLNLADLVLLVLDAGEKLSAEDRRIIEMAQKKPTIVLINKTDLVEQRLNEQEVEELVIGAKILRISAKEELGLNELDEKIVEIVTGGSIKRESPLVSNIRHKIALEEAQANLADVVDACVAGVSLDCLAIDIREAWERLGEITGETVTEDIIDQIFSQFCIGK